MIPDLQDGVLPEGIHDCTIDEVAQSFGQFRGTDHRMRLTETLRQYVEAARKAGVAEAVIIDGSYVTAKEKPGDIDLLLVLKPDFNLQEEIRPLEYNVQSKRMVRRLYGFDVLIALSGSEAQVKFMEFFSRVKLEDPEQLTSQLRKGLLRITL
ncbi:MAG: hypothetical protein JST84_01365 [Acidobacteria bacterium]|nr:hypothetical protein [Acidobacteriota bacterium]